MCIAPGFDWVSKRVLIVGLARSGLAAAELLLKARALPVLYDEKPLEQLSTKEDICRLIEAGCEQGVGRELSSLLSYVDVVLISPAVPLDSLLVKRAREIKLPVIGELELGALFAPGPMYAVTGTNGKTTTVSLLGEMFRQAGLDAKVCGNIGYPLSAAAMVSSPGVPLVVEVSSFQMETSQHFHPHAAAMLNISPDHLDRHGNMERYSALKRKIFDNQTADDFAVLNYDDQASRLMREGLAAKTFWFSANEQMDQGCFVRGDDIILRINEIESKVCKPGDLKLPGQHNLQNALAAITLAGIAGLPLAAIRKTLETFSGVEHRIEFVRTIDGITYINDSKGTNPESTIMAVQSMNRPSVLLAGGYDKRVSFAELAQVIAQNPMMTHVVTYGQTGAQIKTALQEAGYMNTTLVDDMFRAVDEARKLAVFHEGNILLSPACASFDQFKDYEHRGRAFKDYVLLIGEDHHV